jgi:hypothetical protein
MDAMQKDPKTRRHTLSNAVVTVAGADLGEDTFEYADDQGFVVQLPCDV